MWLGIWLVPGQELRSENVGVGIRIGAGVSVEARAIKTIWVRIGTAVRDKAGGRVGEGMAESSGQS